MKIKDNVGKRFGNLFVISFKERRGGHTYWNCLCDCGGKTVVNNNNLTNGHTKSCGCLARKSSKQRMTTHGMAKSKFWEKWVTARQRCKNLQDKRYGGRGIKFYWQSFEEFKKDMFGSYKKHVEKFGEKNTTIDRIDVNDDYTPQNCRWATWSQQSRNRRNNTFITFKKKTCCIAEWADNTGISSMVLRARLKRGWSIKRALMTPVHK